MIIEPITGQLVRLRCAEEDDAGFTLAIRNDPELTKIMPPIHNTLQEQREWISKQRKLDNSCFMVFENLEGTPLGTIGFYNVDFSAQICETGRYISYGSPAENIEAVILQLDYLFKKRKFKKIYGHIQLANKHVMAFNERFGYEFVREMEMDWGGPSALYSLCPESYYARRPKIKKLLDSASPKEY